LNIGFSSAQTTAYGQAKVFAGFRLAPAATTFASGTPQFNQTFKLFMSPSPSISGWWHFALEDEHKDVNGCWGCQGSGSEAGGTPAFGLVGGQGTRYGALQVIRPRRTFTLLHGCAGGTTRSGRPTFVTG